MGDTGRRRPDGEGRTLSLRAGARLVALGISLALMPWATVASGQLSAGVQGTWGSQAALGVGGRVAIGLDRLLTGLETSGTFDYFFPSDGPAANVASWEATANLLYRAPLKGEGVTPYAGLGLDVARYTVSIRALEATLTGTETRTGLHLLGGAMLPTGPVRPFLEAGVTVAGSAQFLLSAGLWL